MTDVTYKRLEGVLRSLGFSLRAVEEKNKVYRHEGTGALVVLPELPAGDLLICAGDISFNGRPQAIAAFARWFAITLRP